ncbi:MAG: hypothetical protein JO257_05990 [Deltaproteobacteria bacterium]|nr:hypothetical protein [Deltaproteobacteria bacterium]
MIAAIRADGATIDDAGKGDCYVATFYEARFRDRFDAPYDGNPEPDDHAHRGARGANSAVRDPGSMPDVASMNLRAVKGVALSIGSYRSEIRRELATATLARLRELGAQQLADKYESAWEDVLDAPSDQEANESGDAHSDWDDEAETKKALARANRQLWNQPSRRTKADAIAASNPIATRRRTK